MSPESGKGRPCPRCGYTIFIPEDSSVTCSECGMVIEPGFSDRNLLRYADSEWTLHLNRGLRASRVLSRITIVIFVLNIAVLGLGIFMFSPGEDSPLEMIMGRIMLCIGFGIILTVIGMPLNVWWLTHPEPYQEENGALRILSLLLLPLLGVSIGFSSPRAGFNLPGLTVMVLYLVATAVLWFHAILMRRHVHSLMVRCESPDSPNPPLPTRRQNFLRWVIPILAILYVLGPLRGNMTRTWTPPAKETSDLLIGLAAIAWFRVFLEYGHSCLKSVRRELVIAAKA